jgi:hypothetical protein
VFWLDGIVGDGSISSTTIDLLKWDRALYANKLISKESADDIFKAAMLNDKSKENYGFGWFLNQTNTYGKIVSHTGGWPGYISYIERILDSDKTIIILQNVDFDFGGAAIPNQEIRKLLYNIPLNYKIKIASDSLLKFVGEYKTEQGFNKSIILENDKLYLFNDNQSKFELIPKSNNSFFLLQFEPEIEYEFVFKKGIVEKYIKTQDKQSEVGMKTK